MNDIHESDSIDGLAASDHFRTTQWQLVRSAGNETDEAVRHLDRLLRRYLPALTTFLTRRYQLDPATADDLLQSFILARILHGRLLELADPQRGRFRTILLSSLNNHVRMEFRKNRAAKRIPDESLVQLEELDNAAWDSHSAPNDEELFEPSLNRQIITETVRRFQRHCDQRGKLPMWEVFENRLLKPMMDDVSPEPYERLIRRLDLESQTRATNLLMSAKRSFVRMLREVIKEFALNVDDAEEELGELQRFCGIDSK